MKRFISLLCCVVVAGLLSSCGEENKVGSDKILDFKEQTNDRLGVTTTTVAAPTETTTAQGPSKAAVGATTTTVAVVATTTTRPPVTTAAPATTVARVEQAFEISINADNSGTSQFDPSASRVFKGTLVRFVNKDSVPRSVEEDRGAFKSGVIAPGGMFDFRADTVGKFNITDGTRPYAVGSLEVLAR